MEIKKNVKYPLISVIVPVYNVESYLKKCVETIIKQTYTNLEILLVDDGSTDNSGKICDMLAEKDKRIKVVHKKNGGLSDARNAGINVCHGNYIAFVDSDDTVKDKFIEVLYKLIVSGNFQVSQVGTQFVDENGKKLSSTFIYGRGISHLSKKQFIEGLLTNQITWAAWCNLYCRDFFKNIRFTKGQYNEDCLMWIDGVENIKDVIISSECLYEYRQRKGSITSGTNMQFFSDELNHATKWVQKIKKEYPTLKDAAYNEFFSDLLIYLRAIGNSKSNKKYISICRKEIHRIIKNKYLPLKRKIMLFSIALLPAISLRVLHQIFLLKNRA